jgi:PAS domain-containing protein
MDKIIERQQKEISAYKYALDESAILSITDQHGVINYVNDHFIAVSKYSKDELLAQDHRILNSGLHTKEFMHDLRSTISVGRIWKG